MIKSGCSIRDLASYVQVAPSTVSRVLNSRRNNVRITEETRKRILDAAQELNYTPNIHAKRLFGKKTNIIGLLVPSYEKMRRHIFEDNHLVRIISGMEQYFQECKYNLLLLFNDDDFIKEKRYLKLFMEKQIDGLLIWGTRHDDAWARELHETGFPYIFLTNTPDDCESLNYIKIDYRQGANDITRLLLNKGHRHIALIRGKPYLSITREQEQGIREALAAESLTLDENMIFDSNYQFDDGYAAARQLLAGKHPVSAIITASDTMAAGVIAALDKHNLRIPDDVAVASLDSVEGLNEFNHLSPVTAKVPDLEIGGAASRQIIQLINGETERVQTVFSVKVVSGETA